MDDAYRFLFAGENLKSAVEREIAVLASLLPKLAPGNESVSFLKKAVEDYRKAVGHG